MSDPRAQLQAYLLANYAAFLAKLAARTRSVELADEALQEVWIRLATASNLELVDNKSAFLFRMAFHIAIDKQRQRKRHFDLHQASAFFTGDAEELDPERVLLGKSELARLRDAILTLPPRQREILRAARLQELPVSEIALKFGLSKRAVQRDLAAAQAHIARLLEKDLPQPRREAFAETSYSKTTNESAEPEDS